MGIVINTSYKAPSYEELVTPIAQMTQTQRSLEDLYATLGDKVQTWNNKLDPNLDQASIDILNKYTQGLSAAADNLMDNGFNQSTYKDIAKLRSLYNSQIAPIQEKYNFRAEQAKQQQLLSLNNSAILFNTDYSKTPLDQIRVGDYGQAYNAAPIIKMVGDNLTKYASSIFKKGEWKFDPAFHNIIGERDTFQGFTAELLKQALAHPESKYGQDIQKIMQQGVDASGIKDWTGNNAKNAKEKLINLLSAQEWNLLGTNKSETVINEYAKMKAQEEFDVDKYAKELALKQAALSGSSSKNYDISSQIGNIDVSGYSDSNTSQIFNRILNGVMKHNGRYTNIFNDNNEFKTSKEIGMFIADKIKTGKYNDELAEFNKYCDNNKVAISKMDTAHRWHAFTTSLKNTNRLKNSAEDLDILGKQINLNKDLNAIGASDITNKDGLNYYLKKGVGNIEKLPTLSLSVEEGKYVDAFNNLSKHNAEGWKWENVSKLRNGEIALKDKNKSIPIADISKRIAAAQKDPGSIVSMDALTGANADKVMVTIQSGKKTERYVIKIQNADLKQAQQLNSRDRGLLEEALIKVSKHEKLDPNLQLIYDNYKNNVTPQLQSLYTLMYGPDIAKSLVKNQAELNSQQKTDIFNNLDE
jgi:hypothetical protein